MSTAKKESISIYDRVTSQIVEALERGVTPWERGWNTGLPKNAVSGREYRGVNVLLCNLHAFVNGFDTNIYVTYKQAQDLGGHVRRGEKGVGLVLWKPVEKRTTEGEEDEPEKYLLARTFTAFSLDQCAGLEELKKRLSGTLAHFDELEECERMMAASGVAIEYDGSNAHYNPISDVVTLPQRNSFISPSHFYAVAAHELLHATGAAHRLNRDMSGRFGSDAYAIEELVAELGASFVLSRYGITEHVSNAAAYLHSWLRVLRTDSRAIFTAASSAARGADYLLNRTECNG